MALNGLKTSNSDRIYNEGSWNDEQCLKYLIFLDLNKSIMTSRQKKKYQFLYYLEFTGYLIR